MKDSLCTEGYCQFLKGKYFGILCDCEKRKPYDKMVDSLLVELTGALYEGYDCININRLYAYTASLKYVKYKYLRDAVKHICIPLVDSIFGEENNTTGKEE